MHARRGVERSPESFELEKERERKEEVNYMKAFAWRQKWWG